MIKNNNKIYRRGRESSQIRPSWNVGGVVHSWLLLCRQCGQGGGVWFLNLVRSPALLLWSAMWPKHIITQQCWCFLFGPFFSEWCKTAIISSLSFFFFNRQAAFSHILQQQAKLLLWSRVFFHLRGWILRNSTKLIPVPECQCRNIDEYKYFWNRNVISEGARMNIFLDVFSRFTNCCFSPKKCTMQQSLANQLQLGAQFSKCYHNNIKKNIFNMQIWFQPTRGHWCQMFEQVDVNDLRRESV